MTGPVADGGGHGAGFSRKGVTVAWPINVKGADSSAVGAADCCGAAREAGHIFAVGPDGTDAANAVDAFE